MDLSVCNTELQVPDVMVKWAALLLQQVMVQISVCYDEKFSSFFPGRCWDGAWN